MEEPDWCEDNETGEITECKSKGIWMTPEGLSMWWGLIFVIGMLHARFQWGLKTAIERIIDI